MLSQKHFSDEVLLARVDGELPAGQEAVIDQHLQECWECRARLAQLEQQIQMLAAALDRQTFPGSGRAMDARRRFLESRAEFENSFNPPQTSRQFLQPVIHWSAFVARAVPRAWACAAAVLALFCLWWLRPPATPPVSQAALVPRQLLAAVQAPHREWVHQPVHQVFRIEVKETSPAPRKQTGKLDVWSEPVSGRFAARWSDARGALHRGVWRPENGQTYSYGPAMRSGPARVPDQSSSIALAELARAGVDADRIEEHFMEWIRSRQWKPVAFAADLATFADAAGIVLEAERRGPVVRLVARRSQAGQQVEIAVEVDALSMRPTLQSVRFESDGRAVELLLATEQVQIVPAALLKAAWFRPDILEREVAAVVPVPAPPESLETPPQALPFSSPSGSEIEALYALHRAGACLGEAVEVVREEGRIRVRGIVSTEARKQELLAVLRELDSTPDLDLKTVDEAVQNSPLQDAESSVRTEVRSPDPPVEQRLRRHLENDRVAMARFSQRAVSLSDTVLSHAWALRRAAELHDKSAASSQRPQVQWLYEVMVRDHQTAIRSAALELRALIGPLLGPENEGRAGSPAPAFDSFSAAERSNRLIHGLFAGAGFASASIDQAIQDLWEALSRISDE